MSRLLDLPLELREKILEYVVGDGTCTSTVKEQIKFDYFNRMSKKLTNVFTTPWTSLARTNKQLNIELESVLGREKPCIRGVSSRLEARHGEISLPLKDLFGYRIIYCPGKEVETILLQPLLRVRVSEKDVPAGRRTYCWYCLIDHETRSLCTYGPCMSEEQLITHYNNGGKLEPGVHTPDFIFKGLNIEIRASEK